MADAIRNNKLVQLTEENFQGLQKDMSLKDAIFINGLKTYISRVRVQFKVLFPGLGFIPVLH
jgi:hypothetical protein